MSVILVVDDDPYVPALVSEILAREDRIVLMAHDISEALSITSEHEVIDVAILDKNLREGSGIELLRTLRAAHPQLEAIIITAYRSLESAVEALQAEAFDYIGKPWDNNHLAATVAAAEKRAASKRKHLERMRDLDHMEAIGSLTASIGREINNPLTCIISTLVYVAERHVESTNPMSESERSEFTEAVKEALLGADRVRRFMEELRSFTSSRETHGPHHAVARSSVEDEIDAVSSSMRDDGDRAG